MLTGDNLQTAKAVFAEVIIYKTFAQVRPSRNVEKIKQSLRKLLR
ncbi:MAG: hypothetical protein ucyna2_00694 [Candidatus Atelocyanobacterium thalassa isolate SIO64986]|uniref:P-type ATPase, translocating n=1 Tax=Candidatus Atelocyanobacterium thalassa isolate SIO64986 TaxID=1527444 RepID=A0A086CH34_9CHRO|nr:MAG: hypothetical protein ucyna2_00694 [Candidatus Atelocyanobacterium thalassa isolate SIO64986]